jgi:hypothetical protein
MRLSLSPVRTGIVLAFAILCANLCFAQFSANIQGTVLDPSGAGVPHAKVELLNTTTHITATTTSDASGAYNFSNLAPSTYQVTAEAPNFTKSRADVTLLTEQILNVPITLKIGSTSDTITVSTEAPVVDTADSRTQLTLENQAVAELPIAGRNLVTLVTMAPGVSGLGTSAGNGTPGTGADNFSTEEAVDASANGQGSDNNQYVVDGLDVTSGIRQGVLNLTPTPDSIQETSIQVNTFSVEHSRGAGLVTAFTTRSGTDQFHGSAADYFNYQGMYADQRFVAGPGHPYTPFHANDFSFAVGGPVMPHHVFFYFAAEPRRGSNGAGGNITFAAPEFLNFISDPANGLSTTVGTHVLTTYLPTGLGGIKLNADGTAAFGAGVCGTPAADNYPCASPVLDSGSFGATAVRNGTQYFGRLDTDFKNDRVYASLYRTLLLSGAPTASPQFSSLNPTWQVAGQITWAHTFSSSTINEASAGLSRVEGNLATGAKDYTVPNITVGGGFNQQLGAGFAQGDFIQHNYHWKDLLTHVHGAHTLKFGYDAWYGDDVENFQGPWSTPAFNFSNILDLAEDNPNSENGVFYNPNTGKPQLASWDAASRTYGLFVEDTWKARRNLTLTLGLRYDDQGNPWSKSATTVFGNFYLGTGNTVQDQVANGYAKPTHNALLHAVNGLVSPRIGFAWDPTGKGDWAVRGGAGIYDNWLTNANVQEEFRGNPPGLVAPGFTAAGTLTADPANFVLGSGNKAPFGFDVGAPSFAPGLNAQGGLPGANPSIAGINPLLKSPQVDIFSLTVERKINNTFAASVGYSGSHGYDLASAGNNTSGVSYGVNVNVLNDDYILNNQSGGTLQRLNSSFGSITYTANDRASNYNGVFFDLKGRFARGFVDASYTRSRSNDDAGAYPTPFNPQAYYGPSVWDVPNRFSLSWNYSLKGLRGGAGALGRVTSGWGISGTSVFQSGEPFTPAALNNFAPVCAITTGTPPPPCPSAGNLEVGYAPGSGDYNADGNSYDFPDALSYKQSTSHSAFLNGSIPVSNFAVPTFGLEGNEKVGQFREPNFAETDVNFYKDTRITERVGLQLRFEFFNIFNRSNLLNVDTNWTDGNFGQATASHLPRWWQIGGKITF